MSRYRVARLPPLAMMSREISSHSGLAGLMPRSRQMSAMTVPIGRLRTWAAMSSGVGRRASFGSAGAAVGSAEGAARRARREAVASLAGAAAGGCSGRLASLVLSAAARSRPRVMQAMILAMSRVPKSELMWLRSLAAVRCCRVTARLRPYSTSLRTRARIREVLLGEASLGRS